MYLLLTLSALSQFPGYFASMRLVERIGRKPTLAAFLFLGGVSAYAFAVADSATALAAALFVGFFNLGAWALQRPPPSSSPPGCARARSGWSRDSARAPRSAARISSARLSTRTGSTVWSLTFVALVMLLGGVVVLSGARPGDRSWRRGSLRRMRIASPPRPVRTSCSTRTTPSSGTRGARRPSSERTEDKLILLSVGYSACHWCHVMEHESFEDEETARLMNERFVCIKVDREERPDVDGLYMEAVVSLTGTAAGP